MIEGDVATQVQSGADPVRRPGLDPGRAAQPRRADRRPADQDAADGHVVPALAASPRSAFCTARPRSRGRTCGGWWRSPRGSRGATWARRRGEATRALSAARRCCRPASASRWAASTPSSRRPSAAWPLVFVAAMAIVILLLLLIYENFRIVAAIVAMPLLAAAAVGLGPDHHRDRAQHHGADGPDHGDRHRHRGGDLLLHRVRVTCSARARRRSAP